MVECVVSIVLFFVPCQSAAKPRHHVRRGIKGAPRNVYSIWKILRALNLMLMASELPILVRIYTDGSRPEIGRFSYAFVWTPETLCFCR